MAVNPRFEIGCNNPDGIQCAGSYSTSQRGHFSSGPSIERSASFRENYEGRAVAQGGGNSGFSGNSGSGHRDLAPLAQVLSLDPVSLGEQKYARQLELRKATNAALGAAVDGNVQTRPVELLGPEELRRVKASIYDNLVRARERSRIMAEAIVKLDKYRTSMNFRKRARPEPSIHEKPITTLSVERSTMIGNSVKICSSPSHTNASDTMLKTEDKNKGAVPNKRVRTSLADMKLEGRQNGLNMQRSSGFMDRDREFLRSNSSHGNQVEERDRSVSEGWEKTKMKGRRSGMKSDATGTTANGAVEGERDSKWQPRLNVEGRSRPSEGHGFRSSPVHGVSVVHKAETAVQQNSLAVRLLNKNESDSSSPIGEKADRYIALDKERVLSKNSIKSLQREENNLSNLATVTKAKAARAPRSGAVNPPLQAIRSSSLGDFWDRPPPNKAQVPVGPTNRKRPAPSRSSSPPVTQWGGQRQKMARVRRMNLVPPVGPLPNKDEALSSGEGIISHEGNALVGRSNSNMAAGTSFVRKVTTTASLSQSKQKSERIGLSESDESESGDVKSIEKGKKLGDSEGRFGAVSQKMGSVLFQAKASPAVSKEEGGDGIRRQGRSGRGLVAMRGNLTIASNEKVFASENQKQLRSTRPGLEKTEKSSDMKPGRPPSKKGAAERKALAKPQRPVGSGTADLSGQSDDDYEDLVAAAHAAVNASAAACSSNFWKQVEPYFTYLTRDDYEYLEQQVGGLEDTDLSLSALTRSERTELIDSGLCNTMENPIATIARNVGCLANGNVEADSSAVSKICNNLNDKESGADVKKGLNGDWLERMIPLSQRLLAALIVEDDIDEAIEEDQSSDDHLDTERDGYLLIDNEQAKVERRHADWEAEEKRCNWACKPSLDDFSTTNGHRYYDEVGVETSVLAHSSEKTLYNSMTDARLLEFDKKSTCLGKKMKENQSLTYQSGNWDVQYQQMNFDDRILLELQSIGLSPEPPDVAQRNNDAIGEELKGMQLELKDQVVVNKERVQALEAVVATSREPEERERERLAMMKLVEIAYARRMGCKAGISSGNKGSSSKGARAAALAFAKRVLARWKNYVETEKSCFTESGLRNILFHFSSKESTPRGAANDSEAGDICTMSAAVEPKSLSVYDSKLPVENVGRLLGKEKTEKDLSDSGQNTASEQTGGKDDVWSSRIRREVLLEDMVGSGGVVESAMLGGTKGKRSERERDGKSQIRDSLGRNEGRKGGGQPGIGSIKGERKAKTKPRQKTAPLLKTVNGLVGKSTELQKEGSSTVSATSGKVVDKLTKGKCESLTDRSDAQISPSGGDAPIDLSHLQLPGIDDLVAPDDLSGQGQDLGSWLDFEDPGLQDAPGDFVGLDVPMDDLSDLAMMM